VRVSAAAREATKDGSRGDRPGRSARDGAPAGPGRHARPLLLALAAVAVALLVVGEFTDLYRVVVGSAEDTRRTVTAGSNHGYAVLLLAVVAAAMLLGAIRGARPAMGALAVIGIAVLFISLAVDLPAARQTGTLREADAFEDARAVPAIAFYLQTLGAAMLLVAGGGLRMLGEGERGGSRRERSGSDSAA
jgi:hypothetical protein